MKGGGDFVKRWSGFSRGGGSGEEMGLMGKRVGGEMGVKGWGGVRRKEDVEGMVGGGGRGIGGSGGVCIMKGDE